MGKETIKRLSENILLIGVLSLAISPQFIAGREATLLGFELTAVHNGLLLISILQAFLFLGMKRRFNSVLIALIAILAITFTFSTRHPLLSASQPFESFAALALGPIIFLASFRANLRKRIPYLLAAIAPLSLVIGFVFDLLNVRDLFRIEYLGVWRLQGAMIPAHLAMVGVIGVFSSVAAALRNPRWAAASLANFAIVVWTGTRIPILVASIGMAAYLAIVLRSLLRDKNRELLRHLGSVAIGAALIGFSYAPIMVKRFTAPQEVIESRKEIVPTADATDDDGSGDTEELNLNRARFDASNRVRAWKFFFEVAQADLLFGRGLGASTVANSGEIHVAYRVPHNEYLRFLVDGGAVGLALILVGYVVLFVGIFSRSSRFAGFILIASFLGLALYAFFDNPISTSQFNVTFWVYLAAHPEYGPA